MRILDSHQHFWAIGGPGQSWPDPSWPRLYRDFGPQDLRKAAERVDLAGSVLVQAQPDDRETDWMLETAGRDPLVKAIVGWVDLEADSASARIEEIARHPKLVGLRPMLQAIPDTEWLLRPSLEPAIASMLKCGLRLDALVQPRHLKPMLQFAKRWPDLLIVINHGAKPRVATGELDPWRDDLAALAALPKVFCKLSGLRTEQAEGQAAELLAPYVSHILKCFTARTMWGSDWPVLLHTQDTYSDWVFTARQLAGDMDHAVEHQLFAGAAAQFYGIALDSLPVHFETLASGMSDTTKTTIGKVPLDSLGKLAFGCAPIGNLYEEMSDQAAAATIHTALDAGVRYFDTAPQYGFGLSEKRLGAVLAERDSGKTVIVSTKVGRRLDPVVGKDLSELRQCFRSPEPFESVFDYSYDGVMRTFEQSQQRLRREHIDILYAHDIGRFAHGADHSRLFVEFLEGGFRAMSELRKSGVVGAIGIAVNECEICTEMLAEVELDIIELAGRYTLLDQQALETLLPLCERRSVRLVIGAPYNSGILASGVKTKTIGHYNYAPPSPDVVARVSAIEAICGAHGVRLAAAALQFPLAHPQVVSVIAGANSPQRVLEAAEAMATEIPSALWSDLKDAGLIRSDAPVPHV